MSELNLDLPKKIKEAVPANLMCGLVTEVPTISPKVFLSRSKEFKIIDVRRADEFNAELGHIAGAELMTLGTELETKLDELSKDEALVFVCRSGKRSAEGTMLSIKKGFKNVYNLEGGMLLWNELKYPL